VLVLAEIRRRSPILEELEKKGSIKIAGATYVLYAILTRKLQRLKLRAVRLTIACLVVSALFPSLTKAQAPAGVPVFEITPVESSVKFDVKASVAIKGVFDKWDATLYIP
jgi:hypothetical protein